MNTSYFAKVKQIKYPVSISRYAPHWYDGAKLTILSPKVSLLERYNAGEVTELQFTEEFTLTVLNKFDPKEIYDRIVSYYTEEATLLCYEKVGDFCHRRLVAKWFETSLGIVVPEKLFK